MSVLLAIALLVGSAVVACAALLLTHFLRIDRILNRLLGPAPVWSGDVHAFIEHLATIADIARREGLLVAERSPQVEGDPLLSAGIALAAEGRSPHLIREHLEYSTATGLAMSFRTLLPRAAQVIALALLAVLLVALLAGAARVGIGTLTFPVAIIAWFLLCAGMITLSLAAAAAERLEWACPRTRTALRIEAVVLIASGQRGSAVRETLLHMLSEPRPASLPRAA